MHVCTVCKTKFKTKDQIHNHSVQHRDKNIHCFFVTNRFNTFNQSDKHNTLHDNENFLIKYLIAFKKS